MELLKFQSDKTNMLDTKGNLWVRIVLIIFLFSFISSLFPYLPGHEYDNSLWAAWAAHINHQGLRNAYSSGTDYVPLFHYILWIYGKLLNNPELIDERIGYLRCFTLFFDFLGLWYAYKWMDKKVDYLFLLLFSILNLAYSYNTVVWGQLDGVMTTLVFVSLYYAYKNKVLISGLLFMLALNMKVQSIIFLPLWGLICLYSMVTLRNWKEVALTIPAMVMLQWILLLPFTLSEGGLTQLWNVVTSSMDRYPYISIDAFNFWHWFVDSNPRHISDEDNFVGNISYKTSGLILFFTSSFFALLPMLIKVWQKLKGKAAEIKREEVWLTAALVTLLFFYLNTQMHERYSHPAFLFLTAYAFYTGRFGPYFLFMFAYFFNLEAVFQFLKWRIHTKFFMQPWFVAILFAFLIVYLFTRLWQTSPGKTIIGKADLSQTPT